MEKFPMTAEGLKRLEDELRHLKNDERPAVIRAVASAREHGDLSENAEYHAASEKQSFIEGRIKELEAMLSLAEVIDPARLSGPIKFGATVTLADEDSGDERTYQIVGEPEADIENGRLNLRSPLARALIGKEEGDSVDVRTPGGTKSYEVLSIRYVLARRSGDVRGERQTAGPWNLCPEPGRRARAGRSGGGASGRGVGCGSGGLFPSGTR